MIKKISLIKFDEGGAAILQMMNINHQPVRIGAKYKIPLVKNSLRVLNFSYVILAKMNKAEDENPWAIIIVTAPYIPNLVEEVTPAINSPIWPTDEYAIRDFISDWRIQINPVEIAPTNDTLINIFLYLFLNIGDIWDMRINPYPPSFSKTAAKIMDPATGASTWAFGSHKCVKNRGNFTINAITMIIHVTNLGVRFSLLNIINIGILSVMCLLYIIIIDRSKGKEAVTVYISR